MHDQSAVTRAGYAPILTPSEGRLVSRKRDFQRYSSPQLRPSSPNASRWRLPPSSAERLKSILCGPSARRMKSGTPAAPRSYRSIQPALLAPPPAKYGSSRRSTAVERAACHIGSGDLGRDQPGVEGVARVVAAGTLARAAVAATLDPGSQRHDLDEQLLSGDEDDVLVLAEVLAIAIDGDVVLPGAANARR